MPVSAPITVSQQFPNTTYFPLQAVLEELPARLPGVTKVLTAADLSIADTHSFMAVVSKSFSVLLQYWAREEDPDRSVQLSFDPREITVFLKDLLERHQDQPLKQGLIAEVMERQSHKANDAKLQSQFTLQLLAALTRDWATSDTVPLDPENPAFLGQLAEESESQAISGAVQIANQAKSDFLATMSHELRTPLTCVIGMSATLLRWSLGPLTDKQRSCLQSIHDSGEHLLELINNILDLSHVQSGKATLNPSPFSLTTLMQQILHVMSDKADTHQVELSMNFKVPPECDRIVADLRRVQQILIILVDNAIKFTPAGGKVMLRVWVEAQTVVFQVEDTGIGISAHKLPHLFERFQQLDTSYRRSYDGAGLGLALAQECIAMHQGWIDVKSIEGHGSTFTVQLPNQIEEIEPSKIDPQTNTMSAGRIVLIDSQEENAALLCDMLTTANYQIIWMVEPSTALEQIRLLQPIALIINAQSSPHQFFSLLDKLHYLPRRSSFKVIVLTPEQNPREQQKYLSQGADLCLVHSTPLEELLRKLEDLFKPISSD
ncbi:MAG: hybrid sensor histidine kinase/response regulator [Acaryochloridaceae cyanobacterium SU_2_1]|nr:hybrid sensor histidine kinase/response regulator [Acaryochloridaceae cyanobacterium SU_2_1]